MHPSRTSAAAARSRNGLVGLLTVSVIAGAGAAAADLSARGARLLPVALEFAALLAGLAALRLAWTVGRSRAASTAPAPSAGHPTSAREPEPEPSQSPNPNPSPVADPKPGPGPRPRPASAAIGPEELQAGARRAFVNLARRIQAAVNRQLRELRELEARHGADPEVFGDLLQVDHATALIGRLADSLAVLGGDRPARRWQRPIPLVSVLRGAMSRITEYRRVEIGPLPERIGVDGGAVEALVHALAELLDNATRYSPPDSRVRLGARPVDGGCVIEVVDTGVGLTAAAAERAALVLRTRDFGLELASLGETPRLGLAVVGRLAHATGFDVSLHRADGGGVRAQIVLPARLLRALPETDPGPARPDQRPHSHRAAEQRRAPTAETSAVVAGKNAHGLPQRRRVVPDGKEGTAPPHPGGAAHHGTPGAPRNSTDGAAGGTGRGTAPAPPGLWLTAFQAGLRGEPADEAGQGDGRDPE